MQILINKITGAMAQIPASGDCGTKGSELLVNPNVEIRLIGGDLASHFTLNHCVYSDGEIAVLPESEWPENQELE